MLAVAKAVLLYVAPLLALTSFLLNLFVLLAPTMMFKDSVSLAQIHPAVIDLATKTAAKSKDIDGPSVLVGLLGSCARQTSDVAFWCTSPSFAATYNMTVIPSSIPTFLTAPVAATPVFAIIALVIFAAFVPLFTLSALREKLPARMGATFSKQGMSNALAWAGVLSWLILTTVYLVMRMWLGRAVEDTNTQIFHLGKAAPQLQAEVSNGFTMIWVAQAFAAVPIVCALSKLHMASVPAGKV
ncbi:hypothetical protein BKA62DRAFT_743852 [Auriculariales sp. MPI-PUGE-AT-0066]|nr:hypothetical protein BKA62DRAFT_743852 [Auriculariales sp. MPI-PUGE-AT-0066]